jgi:hypothetical protein
MSGRLVLGQWLHVVAVTALILACPCVASAGPPFLTDDPVPVDPGHFETYLFSQWDSSAGVSSNVTGPAVEFNWGFLPNLQFHIITPFENATAAGMPQAFGFGDTEIGVKYRFLQESPGRPQIGIFPMAELATGDAARNLGNGRTSYRLPVWLQKSYDNGKWTIDAGGGAAINPAPEQRNYAFGSFLVQRSFGPGLTLGAEVYRQGATADGATATTFYNVGGYINPSDQFSILFSVGHSVAGQSHAIGYFGLYYTFPHPAKH